MGSDETSPPSDASSRALPGFAFVDTPGKTVSSATSRYLVAANREELPHLQSMVHTQECTVLFFMALTQELTVYFLLAMQISSQCGWQQLEEDSITDK